MIVAKITVTLKKGIRDPQGQTAHHALENLGFDSIAEVRIGKVIHLRFDGISKEQAADLTSDACKKLLANPVIEDFLFELHEETNHP
ncbi:MAG: phosphoribosylformylglycinamidine synthase subunit PurS [bacterium]